MEIDLKGTVKKLNAIEKRFNDKDKTGIENSYQCLCLVEDIGKELITFVEMYKHQYKRLMIDKLKKEL